MNATVAREHVRVARALRELAGVVAEVELCELALELRASQLARTVSAFRLAAGTRIKALPDRRYSSQPTGDGMVRISVVLPALVDVAATYLETLPGEPADDHTLVVVHVNAEALDVPAGTPRLAPEDVPAGTSVDSGTCHIEGHGPIEPAIAERLLCTARVQGVLVGRGGKVLSLGRTKRLATRAQRRALMVRDKGICQFPGCHATTHLDARQHHVRPWSHGGPTDLDNLILLCGRHHTLVHEGGLRIGPAPAGSARHWDFWMPEGRRVDADGYRAWRDIDDITMILAMRAEATATADPARISPTHDGAGFSLNDCVRVLFDITREELIAEAA